MSVTPSEAQRSRVIPWYHLPLLSRDSSTEFRKSGN